MVERTKIFYFTVFILVVIAFIFHINAMGHHHWKNITVKNNTLLRTGNITIGLFTQCQTSITTRIETCFPNMYPGNKTFYGSGVCAIRPLNDSYHCDYLPSTKGIASCAIIAAVFLGLAVLILFIHSIKTTGSRSVELILSLFPLILLLLAFIFILIALILVGCYLSRDVMTMLQEPGIGKYIISKRRNKFVKLVFRMRMTDIEEKSFFDEVDE